MFYLTLTARQVNMYKVIYFAVSLIFILAALPQCNARQKHPPKLRTANGTASTSGFPKTPRTDPASDSPSDDATPDQPDEDTTTDYWEGPEEPTNGKTYSDESKTSKNPSKRPSSPSTTPPLPTRHRPAQPTAHDNYHQETTIPRSHRQKMMRRHRLKHQQELERLRRKIQSQENSRQTPTLTDLEASRASSVQKETSQTNDYVRDVRAHWPTVMCFGLSLLILIPLHLFVDSGCLTRYCQRCCNNRRGAPATDPVFYRTISVPPPPAHTPYVPPQVTAHDPVTDRQGMSEARGSLANDHFMNDSARAQQIYQQQVIQQQQTKLAQLEAANRHLRNQVAVEACKLKSQYQQAEDSRPLLPQQETDHYSSTARLNDALDLETCRARAASSAFNRNTRGYASLPPTRRVKANHQPKRDSQEVELVELAVIPEEIYQNPGVQMSPPTTVAYKQQQD